MANFCDNIHNTDRDLLYYLSWQNMGVCCEFKSGSMFSYAIDELSYWVWDKMAAIFQTVSSNVFLWIEQFDFSLKFHCSLFLIVQLTIKSALLI